MILPATPADAKGLLKSAIRSDDPVVFMEHEVLYHDKGEVPDGEHLVPIGKADIKRPGSDVTLITYSRSLKPTLVAAEQLDAENIDAEVIDLRTIRPLDLDTLLTSVVKTHRAVIVEEDWPYCGLGAGISDRITQRVFDELDAPIRRVASLRRAGPLQQGARGIDVAFGRADQGRSPRRFVPLEPEQRA